MDRATVLEHLAMARRHVSQGERHIARQRALIDKIERIRGDTWEARRLLQQFEDLQRLHVEDRDRLERELAEFQKQDG